MKTRHPTPYATLDGSPDATLADARAALHDGDAEAVLELLAPFVAARAEADDADGRGERGTASFLLSVAHAGVGDLEACIAFAEAAAADFPEFPDPHLNRGWALDELGREAEALDAYRESVRLDPSYVNGWVSLAMMLDRVGRHEEALAVFDEALVGCPDDPLVGYKRAVALARAGRRAEATAELRRVYTLDPETREAAAENDTLRDAFPDGVPS